MLDILKEQERFTLKQVAQIMGITEFGIRRMIQEQRLVAVDVFRKSKGHRALIMITRDSVLTELQYQVNHRKRKS